MIYLPLTLRDGSPGQYHNCSSGSGVVLIWVKLTNAEFRDHFVYAPSQWEMALQCNAISHWLGAYTEWSLWTTTKNRKVWIVSTLLQACCMTELTVQAKLFLVTQGKESILTELPCLISKTFLLNWHDYFFLSRMTTLFILELSIYVLFKHVLGLFHLKTYPFYVEIQFLW